MRVTLYKSQPEPMKTDHSELDALAEKIFVQTAPDTFGDGRASLDSSVEFAFEAAEAFLKVRAERKGAQ